MTDSEFTIRGELLSEFGIKEEDLLACTATDALDQSSFEYVPKTWDGAPKFLAWTEDHIYYIHELDFSEYLARLPRNPPTEASVSSTEPA